MSVRAPATYITMVLASMLALLACQHQPTAREQAARGQEQAPGWVVVTFEQGRDYQTGMLNSFAVGYYRSDYGASLATQRSIDALEREYRVTEQEGWLIPSLEVYCALFAVAPGTDLPRLLERLQADHRIESAQLLHQYQTMDRPDYDDPYFALQYGAAQAYIQQLHQWATGAGVDVAIIDTGVDTTHPELARQMAGSRNFTDKDQQGAGQDIHGTAMAGIVAAAANNGSGVVGIAPAARLWSLKACQQLQNGSSLAHCNSFTLARALSFAVDKRIDIINLSLSGPADALVQRLVEQALSRQLVVVAADPGAGEMRYPALLPGVIAAQAAPVATLAEGVNPGELVVVAAGSEVLSTGPAGGYDFFSGSSVAAAFVSGLCALLHEKYGAEAPAQHLAWLRAAARLEASPPPGGATDRSLALVGAEDSP